jgi:hypothetical protein
MRTTLKVPCVFSFLAVSMLLCDSRSLLLPKVMPQSKSVIEGLVRDIACPIQNPEATATHLNRKCLLACARQGSPLVILTKDGELYLPISDQVPDSDQRSRLMPFLGKYVRATGVLYERKGMRAIALQDIEEVKDVHVTIDDP